MPEALDGPAPLKVDGRRRREHGAPGGQRGPRPLTGKRVDATLLLSGNDHC